MANKPLILDHSQYDLTKIVADAEEIGRYNPQRHEMAQLTAICYEDTENGVCVGYRDLGPDEFWVRGHMPGIPIMPGVIMCEAAAQVAGFFALRNKLMDAKMIGYGGLDKVRFRGVVQPGDRFVIVARLLKVRRMILMSEFQCFVNENLVCEGVLKGVPLPVDELTAELF